MNKGEKMEQKRWYYSKTLWANFVAIAAIVVQNITGKDILNPELQGIMLGAANLTLRLITKSEVVW